MKDFVTAMALVLVIEGLLWSVFPEGMKRAAARAMVFDSGTIRGVGLAFAAIGVVIVWFIRG